MSVAPSWTEGRAEHWLTLAWCDGFRKALTLINPDIQSDEFSLQAVVPESEQWAAWEDPVWILFPCDLAESAGLCVGCTSSDLNRLGGFAIGDQEDPDGIGPETFRELISQAASSVAAAIKSNLEREVRFAGGVDIAEPSVPSLGVELRFEIAGEPGHLAIVPNTALVEALHPAPEENTSDGEIEDEVDPSADTEDRDPDSLSGIARRNLEILLDLEMEVAVSFGQTEMPLNDVLKLSVGSIVELNCQASDPVEVLVNDSVIARGEVVVVDSNYGVRITDVSSRKERIQSIL